MPHPSQKIRRLIDLRASESREAPKEIQILIPGVWETLHQGSFSVTPDKQAQAVANFNAGIRKGVAINVEHKTDPAYGKRAMGWITELIDRGWDGLWAVVDWNKEGRRLVEEGEFRFLSPEFDFYYEDPETCAVYENVVTGCALTNAPLFKGLRAIHAHDSAGHAQENNIVYISANEAPMNVQALLAKDPSELSDVERQYLREHISEVSSENRQKFNLVPGPEADPANPVTAAANDPENPTPVAPATSEAPAAPAATETPAAPAEPAVTPPAAPEAPAAPAQVQATETVSISASELTRLQAAENDLKTEREKIRRIEASEQVSKVLISDKGGKFPPAIKDQLVDFRLSLTPTQLKAFDGIVEKMPDSNLMTEIGKDGARIEASEQIEGETADEKVANAATKKVAASEGKVTYVEAMEQVRTEMPELYAEYTAEKEKKMYSIGAE